MLWFFQFIQVPSTVTHVIAVVVGMGGALVSDILFSFFAKDKKLNATEIRTLSLLSKIVLWSLPAIILSGIALFLSDIEKYVHSAKFLAKMTILCVLLVNGYILNTYIWPHLLRKGFFTERKERSIRTLSFVCGAVSVVSWLSVCTLGILNSLPLSYSLIVLLYAVVLVGSMFIAVRIERKEFN